MFTGIVEATGRVTGLVKHADGARLTLSIPDFAAELQLGQSVAVNGACLTVVEVSGDQVAYDLAGETLRCTSLGDLNEGAQVNLERALKFGDRLDGHLVQGHVDGVGRVVRNARVGEDCWLEVEVPAPLRALMIPKGSVTVEGVSLTLASLESAGFACTIIPHTLEVTNLSEKSSGDPVNLEMDVVGKWMQRLLPQG